MFATAAAVLALIFWPALAGPAHAAISTPDSGIVLAKHHGDHHGLPGALLHRLRQQTTQHLPAPISPAVTAAWLGHRLRRLGAIHRVSRVVPATPSVSTAQIRGPPTAS
jgi:hypothetical protein